MKYKIVAVFYLIFFSNVSNPLDNYTNQTFMFTRPIADSISIHQTSWHSLAYKKQTNGSACQISAIYAPSFENLDNSAYFLFDNKKSLSVAAGRTSSDFTTTSFTPSGKPYIPNPTEGQFTVPSFDRDILGQWINVTGTDAKKFTLNPSQKQASIIIEASQDLNKIFSSSLFENWFLGLSVPITLVENNIGISGDKDVLTALKSPQYLFAKFADGTRDSLRVTQAHLSLGTRYLSQEDMHVITSSGIIFPLVEQKCGSVLFEPIQGFNSHIAFNAQALFQFPIATKTDKANSRILFFFDLNNNFLMRNHQLRTYDIKGKPFSRYLKLLDRHKNEIVPGTNVLTLRSRVEPYNIVNLATGFRFKFKSSIGEMGYELWAHGHERVTPEAKPGHLDDFAWQENRYGIAFINETGALAKLDSSGAVVALPVGQLGQTASASTINYVAAPDGHTSCCQTTSFVQQNKYLSLRDLDHFSCAARATVTHRGFVNIGLIEKGKTRDYFLDFGVFIEAAQNNAALCLWGSWLKAGLSF